MRRKDRYKWPWVNTTTYMAYSAMKDLQLYVGKSSTNIFVHDFHEMIAMNGLHYKDILMNVVFSCDTYEL